MNLKRDWNALRRVGRKFFKSRGFRARFHYTKDYEKEPLDAKAIFFESYSASSFSGNVWYIFCEIAKDPAFEKWAKYVACTQSSREQIVEQLAFHGYGPQDYTLVEVHSREYCRVLATSKYLINNSTLPSYFIKRPEQIYFNTWHGTPLKTLGRAIRSAPQEIGNTQRNFFMADYLLYPSEFMFEAMRRDYMLDNMYKGQYALNGYPRNHIFYDIEHQQKIRADLELEDKQVLMYMPTWRGTTDRKNVRGQQMAIQYFLYEINRKLNDDQICYVNIHNFVRNRISFDEYKHIRPFPPEYETYEFLSIGDCLITDYSSVFFDFANTRRKIILFAYDKEEYFEERGVYLPFESLPFPIVETIPALMREINNPEVTDYTSFVETYCPWDYQNTALWIKQQLFDHQPTLNLLPGTSFANGKKNVLIFAGTLAQNGLTTSLRGLLSHIDPDSANYYVLFYRSKVKKYIYVIHEFPPKINYISIQGAKDLTISEAFAQAFYFRLDWTSPWILRKVRHVYEREERRLFAENQFADVIHFTGYEKHMAMLFGGMKHSRRIMYVHNDMRKEKSVRSNYHVPSIFSAYRNFDAIAGVRESIKPELLELLPDLNPDKIHTVHNVNNIEHIQAAAKEPLTFDEITFSTHTVEQVNEMLADKKLMKFVNVARFSPEKGLGRLIETFERFEKSHPDCVLIVIGGHGAEFNQILQYCEDHQLDKVVLIRSLSNPFPIVAQSDVFILSSFYEGLPMSIMEALILGKPVICTDITGPREFLQQGYGQLVSNDEQGLYEGMEMAYNHELHLKPFDAEAFNEQALAEFYDIL